MKKLTILLCLISLLFNSYSQENRKRIVYYDTDSFYLKSQFITMLDSMVAIAKKYDYYMFAISGHTDDIADSLYNLKLSEKRSQSVYQYIVKSGVDTRKIVQHYFGENNPSVPNKSEATRKLNRRTEVSLEILPVPESDDISHLFEKLSSKPQSFCIDQKKDTVLVCQKGTIIYIRANSFEPSECVNSGCIEIRVREVNSKKDMILENLTTTSNDQIIISQCMLEIEAYCHNRKLEAKLPLTVFSPTDTIRPEMKLFTGDRDSSNIMNWQLTDSRINGMPGRIFNNCWDKILVGNSKKCPLFFCKIRNFFELIFKKNNASKKPPVPSTYNCTFDSLKKMDSMFAKLDGKKLINIPKDKVEYYIYERLLGWTNLDWMMKIQDKIPYGVNIQPENNLCIRIAFKDYRSVIPLNPKEDKYDAGLMPNGYKAWVVALKYVNSMPMLAIKDITIDSNYISSLQFEELSIEKLKKKLEILDNY